MSEFFAHERLSVRIRDPRDVEWFADHPLSMVPDAFNYFQALSPLPQRATQAESRVRSREGTAIVPTFRTAHSAATSVETAYKKADGGPAACGAVVILAAGRYRRRGPAPSGNSSRSL